VSFPCGVWGEATPVNDFWSTHFCVILRVLVYFRSRLLAIITPKYRKIENITGVDKVMLHALIFIVRRSALHGICDSNSVCLSVRLSVCLSHSWTVSTWFDLRS